MKPLPRFLVGLFLSACSVVLHAQQSAAQAIQPGFLVGSTAVRLNIMRAHGLATPSSTPSKAYIIPAVNPNTVVNRPGTQQVNSDQMQDAEPTTLTITNAGASVTSVVWMSDPGNFSFKLKYSSLSGTSSTSGTLSGIAGQDEFADPMQDANFKTTGVAPGRVYCTGLNFNRNTLNFTVMLWWSGDGGRTWSAGTPVAQETSGLFDLDHPSVTVTQNNGYVYVVYSRINLNFPSQSEIYVSGSADGGVSFGSPVCVVGPGGAAPADFLRAPQIVSDPSGNLYVEWEKYSPTPALYISRSTTFGWTFEAPVAGLVGRQFFLPGNEVIGVQPVAIEASTLPMIRFNAAANNIAVVWHEQEASPNTQYADCFYTYFDAATRLWSPTVMKVNQDGPGHDHFMPAVDCDSAGNVIIDWYDRRSSSTNLLYEVWATMITPTSNTFVVNNFQITTWATDPTYFPTYGGFPNHKFVGDYHQVFRTPGQQFWHDAFVANPAGGYSDVFLGSMGYN